MKELIKPKNLEEVIDIIADKPGKYGFLAGGTDIIPSIQKGIEKREYFIDISSLKEELSGIEEGEESIIIKAMTTFEDIQKSEIIKKHLPNLSGSAKTIGGFTIQAMATIAGNIVNSSPAADSLPVLLVYGAKVHAKSYGGTRVISLDQFYKGYKKLALADDEIVVAVEIPKKGYKDSGFIEVGTRKAVFISKLSLAFTETEDGINLASGSVFAYPKRLYVMEKNFYKKGFKKDEIEVMIKEDVSPIDDIRSSGKYRLHVLTNLVYDLYQRKNS